MNAATHIHVVIESSSLVNSLETLRPIWAKAETIYGVGRIIADLSRESKIREKKLRAALHGYRYLNVKQVRRIAGLLSLNFDVVAPLIEPSLRFSLAASQRRKW